jgi:2-keto-4-pentenoate hydratase/2-oxohepta-3-ene-1,7-dioic acid hydratase in catechol pathway
MVTANEVPDPDAVPLSLEVNGEPRQSGNTSQLIYESDRNRALPEKSNPSRLSSS